MTCQNYNSKCLKKIPKKSLTEQLSFQPIFTTTSLKKYQSTQFTPHSQKSYQIFPTIYSFLCNFQISFEIPPNKSLSLLPHLPTYNHLSNQKEETKPHFL